MAEALLTTSLGSLPLLARGKVRDIYAVSDDPASDLIFIATDRISAFDHVLGSGIPDKGRILTQIVALLVRLSEGPGSESRRGHRGSRFFRSR